MREDETKPCMSARKGESLTVFCQQDFLVGEEDADWVRAADREELVDGAGASVDERVLPGEARTDLFITPDKRPGLIRNGEFL